MDEPPLCTGPHSELAVILGQRAVVSRDRCRDRAYARVRSVGGAGGACRPPPRGRVQKASARDRPSKRRPAGDPGQRLSNGRAAQVVVAARAGGHRNDAQLAVGSRHGRGLLGVDFRLPRAELVKSLTETPEVIRPRRRRDVDAHGDLVGSLDDAGKAADHDERHAVPVEHAQDRSRVECRGPGRAHRFEAFRSSWRRSCGDRRSFRRRTFSPSRRPQQSRSRRRARSRRHARADATSRSSARRRHAPTARSARGPCHTGAKLALREPSQKPRLPDQQPARHNELILPLGLISS